MKDYYKILGVNTTADDDRIRRAYRVLARRYHPDVNPDQASGELFKDISEAYRVLLDPAMRKKYEEDFADFKRNSSAARSSSRLQAYQKAAEERAAASYYEHQKRDLSAIKQMQSKFSFDPQRSPLTAPYRWITARYADARKWLKEAPRKDRPAPRDRAARHALVSKVSVIEVPVTIRDAVQGIKKSIVIDEPGGERTIKVSIPAGVRTGSIVRLTSSTTPDEEIVLVVRLEKHPHLSIDSQGLTVEIPITINEAVAGATIKVPTLDEQVMVKIPPNTQSGARIRIKEKGLPGRDGPGDLFLRVLVRVPESEHAVGLKEKSADLDLYYEHPVREHLPKTLLEDWS